MATQFGTSSLTNSDLSKLSQLDVDTSSLPEEGDVETMYKFGVFSTIVEDQELDKMSLKQFRDFLIQKKFLKLTPIEQTILEQIKTRIYDDFLKLKVNFEDLIKETYKGDFRKQLVQDADVKKQIALDLALSAKSRSELRKKIVASLPKWSRQVDLVTDTTMHEVFSMGRAMSIVRDKEDGGKVGDEKVYVRVLEGACKSCVKIYLTNGEGSQPIIFQLKDLLAAGNNFGLKRKDWKAVIPPSHPYCRCMLEQYLDDSIWNEEIQDFVISISDPELKRKRKSKAKIKIIRDYLPLTSHQP
mgnify:CR=1 FL=1